MSASFYCSNKRMDYEKLIEIIQTKPALWNPKDSNYHNREYKALLWNELAEKLECAPETARNKWSSLRDSFRREHKKVSKRSHDDVFEPKWPFYKKMQFLIDGAKETLTSEVEIKYEAMDSVDNSMDPLDMPETPVPIPEITCDFREAVDHDTDMPAIADDPKAKKKRLTVNDKIRFQAELLELEKEKINFFKQRCNSQEIIQDEDYYFAMSLVSSMRKVPENRKMPMRMRLMQVITDELYPE